MQGLRLKPRVSPWVVPLAATGLTIATSLVAATTGALEQVLPFSAVPILAALGYLVYSRMPRLVTVEADQGQLQVEGYERHTLRIRPTEVVRKRWVYPVLGTRQGDALVIRGTTPEGRELVLSFGVIGGESAQAANPSCEQVDISLGATEFAHLTREFHTGSQARDSGKDAETTFALVPHRGAGAVFGQMLPWFGTMVLVGVLGALGEPLMQTAAGTVVLFGAVIASVGGGLFYTFRRASPPKRETLLRLSGTSLILGDALTPTISIRLLDLHKSSEIYVYRTKYGTFRFPVLVLSGGSHQLRIGVWEDYTTVGVPLAPEGAAPDYLVNAKEYRALVRQLGGVSSR